VDARAERHRAFRDLVVEAGKGHGEGLVERMEGGEVGPLDVPVGHLDLRVEVEPVGEGGVERLGHPDPGLLGESAGVRYILRLLSRIQI